MMSNFIGTNKLKQLCVLSFLVLLSSLVGCSEASKNTTEMPETMAAAEDFLSGGNAYERSYSPNIGPVDAKVTIVEYFDPACEACRAFYPIVKDIVERHSGEIRLVLRYAAFHKDSDIVIRMLETAREQNVFGPVLEALLKDQEQWASHHKPNLDRAWELAENAGLNIEKAKAEMNSEKINKIIEQENEDIRKLGIRQTPTFFVNEKPLTSFGPEPLYELVMSELGKE